MINLKLSSKVKGAALFSVLIITSALTIKNVSYSYHAEQSPLLLSTISTGERDSDSDGLMDWEEVLWGTDPNKWDSGEEGVSDAEYVRQSAGASSLLSATAPSKTSSFNQTGSLGVSLFAEYLALREQNALTATNIENVASGVVDNAFTAYHQSLGAEATYKPTSLPAAPNDINSIKIFGNKFAEVFFPYANIIFGAPQGSLETLDTVLKENANRYRQAAQALSLIPTPGALASDMAGLLNSFNEAGRLLEDISLLREDPLKMIFALERESTVINGMGKHLYALKNLIVGRGILYSDSEFGSFWMNL